MYRVENHIGFLNPAKYIYWDGVFTDDEIVKMSKYFSEKEKFKIAKIGSTEESGFIDDYRKSNIKTFDPNQETLWIFDKFNSIINFVNEKYFRYDFYGYNNFQYAEYPSDIGGHYGFHMDLLPEMNAFARKLSVSFLLNEPGVDFEGGEFEFTMSTPEKSFEADLKKGRMIFFPSWMIHRVKPVTEGVRKSVVL